MGSARDKGPFSREKWRTLAKTFVTEGLDPRSISPNIVLKAMDAGELVTWERGNRLKFVDPAILERPPKAGAGVGLRLMASIPASRSALEIRKILGHPGYEASVKDYGHCNGLASFVLGMSPESGWGKPALSWPLRVTGTADVLKLLKRSNAVRRGLVELIPLGRKAPITGDSPFVFAELVNFSEPAYSGDALGLRFFGPGSVPSNLPARMNFGRLKSIEPTVFLRKGRSSLPERFTRFVYELSHNKPVDVAAWHSMRTFHKGQKETPLVVANTEFLAARISDTFPALQSQLRQLGDTILPIKGADMNRFGVRYHLPSQRGFPASTVANILDSPHLRWDQEQDTGEGIVAIRNGIKALKQESEQASSAPSPRYTDIKILDASSKPVKAELPLKRAQRYTLDVAIRVKREGLSRDRADQPDVSLPHQTETVSVWVVISDETDGDENIAGKFFKLDQRVAELKLPATGDSQGSAKFPFTTPAEGYGRGRIAPRLGVRIYYKLNLIDHIQLNLCFRSAARKPGIELVFKHAAPARGIETPDPAASARELTISISKADEDSDLYTIAFVAGKGDGTGKPHLSATKKLSELQLNSWAAEFRNTLLNTVFGPSFGQLKLPSTESIDFINSLSSLGTRIAAGLFDYGRKDSDFYKLGKMVRETLPDTSIVQISLGQGSQDFVFPWQILTLADYNIGDPPADPKNLWGYRFIIEVKRCGDGADIRPPAARQLNRARITYGHWPFKNEPQHFAKLEALVNATNGAVQLLTPVVEARDDMIAALNRGGGELFYVYAHGYSAAPSNPSAGEFRKNAREQIEAVDKKVNANLGGLYSTEQLEAWKDMQQQFLKATALGADSRLTLKNTDVELTFLLTKLQGGTCPLLDAPIIFLNTCESAQVWNAIEDSFVSVFLNNGARAVLGTESTIPIVLADEFGQSVLGSMINGSSLGKAVLEGRDHLLNDHQNPLGLCYCIYGDADARLLSSTEQTKHTGGP